MTYSWTSWNMPPGAILANGRGGRETTLWTSQKYFFNMKIVIFCFQTNGTRCLTWSFVQNTADKVLWGGYWTLSEYKLRKTVRKRVEAQHSENLRPPFCWFLEWPLAAFLSVHRNAGKNHPKKNHFEPIWLISCSVNQKREQWHHDQCSASSPL